MSVYRIYVEKAGICGRSTVCAERPANRSSAECYGVRILNRYDADHLTEEAFQKAIPTVFLNQRSMSLMTPFRNVPAIRECLLPNTCRDSLTSGQTAVNSVFRFCCKANAVEFAPLRSISSAAI